jgi:hypothetical protein
MCNLSYPVPASDSYSLIVIKLHNIGVTTFQSSLVTSVFIFILPDCLFVNVHHAWMKNMRRRLLNSLNPLQLMNCIEECSAGKFPFLAG